MKRILLVNACLIGDDNGTGNTLASVFSSLPKENIYQLCVDFLRNQQSEKQCYFVDKEFSRIRYILAKRRLRRKQSAQAVEYRLNISGASASDMKGKVHEFFRGLADSFPVAISKSMKKYIDTVKPEVIYTCGSSITVVRSARKIARKYNIPLVLHIMDNWEDTLYRSCLITLPFSLILKHELKLANKLSPTGIAISRGLCDKLTNKYGVTYFPLMNTVDCIEEKVRCFEREKLIFLYAGSLSINRHDSLAKVAKCIETAYEGGGYIFKLFVPPTQNTEENRKKFEGCNVEFNDYIPREQLYKEYLNADILVIAESFDKNFCDFTKYSLSTKIPEYMASGKPILAYLSDSLFSYEYLKKSGAALVANCEKRLLNELQCLRRYDERRRIAENGLKFVKKHHSREYCDNVMREIFK